MDEEEKRLRIEATKIAIQEWLDEEKKKTYETIGSWFVNAVTLAIIAIGMYLLLWVQKHKV